MLNDNRWITYATGTSPSAYLDKHSDELVAVSVDDAPDFMLEFWKYEIDSTDNCVDDISLYLSLRDNDEDDPRLDDALDTLRERICS